MVHKSGLLLLILLYGIKHTSALNVRILDDFDQSLFYLFVRVHMESNMLFGTKAMLNFSGWIDLMEHKLDCLKSINSRLAIMIL